MRWKVYSVIYAALLIGGMFLPLHDALDIFYVIPSALSSLGLLLYAFNTRILSENFWRVVSWFLIPCGVVSIIIMLFRLSAPPPANFKELSWRVIAVLIDTMMTIIPWVAVRRLSQGRLNNTL